MDGQEREFRFHQETIRIGKGEFCDLCLTDVPEVTRNHLHIDRHEEGWQAEDVGSNRGTTLNGVKLKPFMPAALRDNDCLVLADAVKIRVRSAGSDGVILQVEGATCRQRLTDAQERELCKQAAQGDRAARDRLLEATLPLVKHIAKRYSLHNSDLEDLTQEGILALLRAIEKYDWNRDISFTAFAAVYIRHELQAAANRSRPGEVILADDPMSPDSALHCAQFPEEPESKKPVSKIPHSPMPPKAPVDGRNRGFAPKRPRRTAKWRDFFPFLDKKEKPAPATDDIQFRAAAPGELKRGQYFLVKLMAYLESDYGRADREQKTLGNRVAADSSGIFEASPQQNFQIRLFSQDFAMEEKLLDLTWNGKYASTQTDILLPKDYTGEQVRLVARVSSGIRVLTDLILILQVQAAQPQEVVAEKRPIRTAFASYASLDRDKVLDRIQGLLLGLKDLDVFLDKKDLIPGESWEKRLYREIDARDIFYLFWSNNARKSEWVQKELAYAIEKKGSWFIHPVALEAPEICPPPEQLRDRHFDDWTRHYRSR